MLILLLISSRTAKCQFWFGSGQPVTNFAGSSCVATTYTSVPFPGALLQLSSITNAGTQTTNSFSSSFTQGALTPSNTVAQLPSTFLSGQGTQLAPWATNLNYPPTNIIVPVYWYFTTQPLAPGGSNFSMQAQP